MSIADKGLQKLLDFMNDHQATDLFVSPGAAPCVTLNGVMTALGHERLDVERAEALVRAAMTAAQWERFISEHEANFALSLPGKGRFRVSAFYQRSQVSMVVRRIRFDIPELEALGVPSIVKTLVGAKRGLILLVGSAGSGKSTTLAALVQERSRTHGGHTICIEDPIEYVHAHQGGIVSQREVGLDTESFEVALKNALRQAPDVVVIGEIRTRETLEYALAFANTGHLCLATMHATNADQALERMVTFFPGERHAQIRMDLSLNLQAIVGQRLLPTSGMRDRSTQRALACEILTLSPLVATLIREGRIDEIRDVMRRSSAQGMATFDQALFSLVKRSAMSQAVALAHADSPSDLKLMFTLDSGNAPDGSSGGLSLEEF
ncbi:PilT/PilU family type 4a pilus ATPase [Larsenimonas salina]|uniref:PilT/PilU family type 4a pilus ATPase n=1 Tax=Larsenimonas salina TaxID=1295565 RepID=UPI0020748143|nr:PilT/PilU family type 4a pilus ATPase [Larsenimonas salina]